MASQDEPFLVLGELHIRNRDGGFVAAECEFDSQMPVDHAPSRPIDNDLRNPADLGQRAG